MDAILALARRHGLRVIEDAAHAIESACPAGKVGAIGDFAAFSFYATKNLTTGEGGALTTNDDALADRARLLSLHGISKDAWKRYAKDGPLHWETLAPGYKYNMFDIQAALGLAQFERLEAWWHMRSALVRRYRTGLADIPEVRVLAEEPGVRHAYHLLVIVLDTDRLREGRDAIMSALRAEGIGTGIHFRSLSLHSFYRERYSPAGDWVPVAERYTFDDTRAWVESLSRAVGATVPDLVSWEWEVSKRGGRTRLDYTQNAINKTLVAPFSTRPVAGAPVSVPIGWDELDDPDLSPDRWTIASIGERLVTSGDPLAPLIGMQQRLPEL
jgi:hypothetical protein